jgi:hypothetical protein
VYLNGNDGITFKLEIVDYQFPDEEYEEYDSNWLLVRVSASLPAGAWTVTDPCLLTYEVARLADWLDAVATGSEAANETGFVEPNLWFQVVRPGTGESCLRVYFELECRPPWAYRREAFGSDLFAEFALSDIDLHHAAESLRAQLSLYPQRAAC